MVNKYIFGLSKGCNISKRPLETSTIFHFTLGDTTWDIVSALTNCQLEENKYSMSVYAI